MAEHLTLGNQLVRSSLGKNTSPVLSFPQVALVSLCSVEAS